MRTRLFTGLVPVWTLGLLLLGAAHAASAATLTVGTANGLAGQTVTVNLTASDLTGLNVRSYQFDVAYAPNVVTAIGVTTTGTMTATAGWATPTFNVTSGKIRVSAAGTTPLTGSGTLLQLRFTIDPSWINGNSTSLTLSNAIFNEGTPAVTTSNGSITVNATPQIFVSPNAGEIAVGQTLQFNATGSVSPPVTWSTTAPSVASINSSGLLTGLAPGATRVNALDNAAHADQDDGDILVRITTVTVGTATGTVGGTVQVPITTGSLTGFNVTSGQFQVSWDNRYLTLGSVTTGPTSMLNGYGTFTYGVSTLGTASTATIAFAGATALSGADTLFVLNYNVDPVNYGGVTLTLNSALFNESYPALRVSGSVNTPSPSTFSISPGSVTLLAGQTQQFTTVGTVTPPVTWSMVPDTLVARINGAGLLTAKAAGVTQVKAVDSSGGRATSGVITVYDLTVTAGTITVAPGAVAHVPILVDRDLTPLAVRAVEYTFGWSPTYVLSVTPTSSGQIGVWGAPTTRPLTNAVKIAAAGAAKLGPYSVIEIVDVATSASAPSGTNIPITLTGVLLNEGHPLPIVANGQIQIRSGPAGVDDDDLAFALAAPAPNPSTEHARFDFALPRADAPGTVTRLDVYSAAGRRVRALVADALPAGRHEVTWDLRADDGGRVGAGIYFARLVWAGQNLERKLIVLH